MRLGCCYYPEHWNPAKWLEDARMMAQAGITFVRIGEYGPRYSDGACGFGSNVSR